MENQQEQSSVTSFIDVPAERRKRIRRLIILIVLISVGVHLIFGVGAGIWVIARYFTRPQAQFTVQKTVNMQPEEREHQLQMEEVTSLRPKPVYNNRIQSLRPSKLALPELPTVPLDAITPIDTDALVSEQIDGMGKYGDGSGKGGGFFGGAGMTGTGLLEGTFYDLKQTGEGQPTDMAFQDFEQSGKWDIAAPVNGVYDRAMRKVVSSGMSPSSLREYFRSPRQLYLSQLYIPAIAADEAPKAFEVSDKVKGRRWVALYRGVVSPPVDGNYRFAGWGDDVLVVRFNNRVVLDASLAQPTGKPQGKTYPHSGLPYGWQTVVGASFQAKAGAAYPMELLIGERPGGEYSGYLLLEKIGEKYEEEPGGAPLLPLFKLAPTEMPAQGPVTPPLAPDTPWSVWSGRADRMKGTELP